MLLVALVVGGLGAAYLMAAVPMYRSTAAIVVRFGRSAIPTTDLARDALPFSTDQQERREMIQAHADILTSPDVAQAAIAKFGLARLYPQLAEHPPLMGTAMDAAVKRFGGDIFVSPELAGTVITLGFSHPDPKIAQEMLDTLIEAYMQRESQIFAESSYGFQKTQTDAASKRLTTALGELTAYKASTGVSDFDSQMAAMIKQQSELRSRLNIARVSLAESTQRRDTLAQLLTTIPAAVTNSAGDKYRQVDEAQARVNELQSREREMIASHGPDWPALRALRSSIQEASSSISSAAAAASGRRETRTSEVYQNVQMELLKATANSTSDQQAVKLMTGQSGDIDKQIGTLEAMRAGLVERQREVDIADSAYRTIALHLEDSRIGADRLRDGISRVAVITQPNLPYSIFSPRYRLMGMATAAAAVLAGLFFGFLLEFFDDRIVSAQHVAGRLKVPVLATFDKV